MTVTTNDRRLTYPGNGVSTVFPGPRIFDADDLAVYEVDDATGTASLKVSPTYYTVTGITLPQSTVTLVAPLAAGTTLLLLRTVPYLQSTRFRNQGSFFPELHEDEFDRAAMRDQQLVDALERSVRFSDTYIGGASAVFPSPESLAYIRFNLAADALEAATAVEVPFYQDAVGAVTRPNLLKMRDVVSVKDFGAVGDGATDDSAAVALAFAAFDDVYFPPGIYVVGGLTFAGKRIFGDGATLFWKAAAAVPLLTVTGGGAEIRGLKFDGNAANQTITSSAVKVDADQASVIACEFRDFHGRMLTFHGENCLAAHNYFHDTGVAANCNCIELTNRCGIVHANRFINIGDGHVVRIGYQSVVRDCDGFIIANNFVKTTLHGTFTCELGANRGLIIGNTVDGADAAYKTETDPSIYDITIAYNTVMNLTDAGNINLHSNGVNYVGNRHYNLPNGGPFFGDNCRCEGNFFRDVSGIGVFTAGNRVDFINNTFIDPDVVLAGQVITPQGNCRVSGNRIVDTASDNLGIGIRVFGTDNIIEGNYIEGLDVGVALATTCGTSTVRNNVVKDCPSQSATVTGLGSNLVDGNVGFSGAIPNIEIVAGVLTVSPFHRCIRIITEGSAATDDLNTISGGVIGQVLIVGTASNAMDTTMKDATGNLGLAGDFAMITSGHRMMLEYNGTNWFELSRAVP